MHTLTALWFLGGCDADQDGLSNREERAAGLDPKSDDTDHDGLLDPEELALGTDPFSPDTDADRLLDGAEDDLGADPLAPDTDGDGYLDGDEVVEGRDPSDARSKIYEGGWPYYFAKDELPPATTGGMVIGEPFLRFELVDQFGEEVDLFDFYDQDRPVVLAIGAAWVGQVWGLDSYIRGGDDLYGYADLWEAGPEVVARGDVRWIDILAEDVYGGPAEAGAVFDYAAQQAGGPVLPVLADSAYRVPEYVSLSRWPTVIVLDPQLRALETDDEHTIQGALRWLAEAFPE